MDYQIFDPLLDKPPEEVSRDEARQAFDWYVRSIPERIRQLTDVLACEGIDLSQGERILGDLNKWFIKQIETRAATEEEQDRDRRILGRMAILASGNRLSSRTYSLIVDIAMFLGSLLSEKTRGRLRVELVTTPKSDASYHRPVIKGFTNIPNKNYHVDLEGGLVAYAYSVADGKTDDKGLLVRAYESCLRMA